MTDSPNTTTTDADAMPWPESPAMDLQGVQAILQLLAWAEDSMPYECIGETRRLALMLLEDTMGRAMRNLGLENLDMERDKAAAAAKAKPVAEPWKVGTSQAAVLSAGESHSNVGEMPTGSADESQLSQVAGFCWQRHEM